MEIPIIQNKHLFEWIDTFTICSDWESGLQNNFSLRTTEYIFLNGDVYLGRLKGMLPHESRKYAWSGGTDYEGDWDKRKSTGKGKLSYVEWLQP
ncbi:hypothetical protein ACET3Z_011053 [Daucus carota]